MDADRFDGFASRMASGVNRRHAIAGMLAGTTGFFVLDSIAEAKKRRKKRCKPRRSQAACSSNKQCCMKKTRRKCASNRRTGLCNQTSNVCCLPVGSLGCNDTCDCCGGDTIACDLGSGRCDFL